MKKQIFFLGIALLAGSYLVNAATVVYDDIKLVPNPKTANADAFVSNPDGILSGETVRMLNTQLDELEKETSAEVAVVAVNSIGQEVIEDFANKLFNHWGIGKAGADNGVLVLFVLDQRAIRFEIGYGLEGALPDAICKRIQTQAMIPEFKDGNYDAGILAGVDIVTRIIKDEPVPELTSENSNWSFFLWATLIMLAVCGLVPFLVLHNRITKITQNRKYENNASRYAAIKSQKDMTLGCTLFLLIPLLFFGIFLLIAAFAVGKIQIALPVLVPLLGGLLPVNIWAKKKMKNIRQAPIPCKACGGTMQIVPEAAGSRNLNTSQQFEKKLRSADYDVFKCRQCQKEETFTVELSSKYSRCSKCGTIASVKKSQKTITSATYTSTGVKEVTYSCLFCQHTETKNETIPRRTSSSSSSGGSRSSSGGSFGGGRSGGGGSTSRW